MTHMSSTVPAIEQATYHSKIVVGTFIIISDWPIGCNARTESFDSCTLHEKHPAAPRPASASK